jgi:hypothetical protein
LYATEHGLLGPRATQTAQPAGSPAPEAAAAS